MVFWLKVGHAKLECNRCHHEGSTLLILEAGYTNDGARFWWLMSAVSLVRGQMCWWEQSPRPVRCAGGRLWADLDLGGGRAGLAGAPATHPQSANTTAGLESRPIKYLARYCIPPNYYQLPLKPGQSTF